MTSLSGLFQAAQRRPLATGEALFRQGDLADKVFLIEQGTIRMVRRLPTGAEIPLHTGRPGELFAEGALFSGSYQCDAFAPQPATVLARSKADVLAAFDASPSLALEWLERVTRQLHATRALIELRDVRSAEERVLRHLRLRADAMGVVAFEGRLLDAAAELGLTHEAYYRALAALAQQGMIRRGPRLVQLIQPTRSISAEAPA